jgi:rare lipoprotein A
MSKFVQMSAIALALLASAAPASAQDWISSILAETRRQNGATEARPAAKAAQATKAQKTTRVAAKSNTDADDGSRPQRKAAASPQPRESLSGSGGEVGVASYYWQPQPLASGGRFNPEAMTAAHKTLPFGTRVRVTRLDNGNSVDVTINDRGPYISGRIIDLSRRAARDIGMTGQGVSRVRVNVIGRG